MPENDSMSEIAAATLIGRCVQLHEMQIISTDEGERLRPTAKAFYFRSQTEPPDNSKDGWVWQEKYKRWVEEGISVARGDIEDFRHTLTHPFLSRSEAVFTLSASQPQNLQLTVVPRPHKNNLAHAEIQGLLPPKNIDPEIYRSDEEHKKAIGNAFALSQWAQFSACRTTHNELLIMIKNNRR